MRIPMQGQLLFGEYQFHTMNRQSTTAILNDDNSPVAGLTMKIKLLTTMIMVYASRPYHTDKSA